MLVALEVNPQKLALQEVALLEQAKLGKQKLIHTHHQEVALLEQAKLGKQKLIHTHHQVVAQLESAKIHIQKEYNLHLVLESKPI